MDWVLLVESPAPVWGAEDAVPPGGGTAPAGSIRSVGEPRPRMGERGTPRPGRGAAPTALVRLLGGGLFGTKTA